MAKVVVLIPAELGLTDEQTRELKEKFESQIVESSQAKTGEIAAAAKAKSEVVRVDVVRV
jgi:hypothetical protein